MSLDGPQVLVEPSDYVLRNFGDMAMLRAAVEQLATVLPGATIQVLTDEPEVLRTFCPSAVPLAGDSRHLWLNGRSLKAFLDNHVPGRLANRVQRHIPETVARFLERYLSRRSQFVNRSSRLICWLSRAWAEITDYFPDSASGVLRTMELAIQRQGLS